MLEVNGSQAEVVWLSNKSKSDELVNGQGMLYVVNGKQGQVTAESYGGETPAKAFEIRYSPMKSVMDKDHIADLLVVFDADKGVNYKYDNDVRELINQVYNLGDIPFSANVNKTQTKNSNSEALNGFDFAKDNEALIRVTKQYFGIEKSYNTKKALKYRFNQKESAIEIVDVLEKNKLCLCASYTGFGKSIVAIDVAVRLFPKGGIVLLTTPIVDTMTSFKNDINGIYFGDNRDLVVTYMDGKEFKKVGLKAIKKRVANGELIFIVLSVQDIRYGDSVLDNESDIRKKYSMLDGEIDLWIKDERHNHYEGIVTKKKFKNLTSKYQLDLTATPYNVFSYYSENTVVSQTLIWGLINSKYTNLPNISIESFNSSFSGLSTSIKNMYNIEEGFNPKKLFERDLDTKQFIHEAELIKFAFSCYCKSFSKSKNPFSINNDTKLSNMSKKYGMWVLPNGINKDSATDYIPALAQLLNDNINDNIYFIDSYQLEKDAKNDNKTVGKYYEKLTTKYNRVIILTCGKFLTGSDIPLLGHLVLLDKIQNISMFEQVMGRILRVVDGKKFTKIYSLSPSNELGLVLGKLAKANSYLSGDDGIKILDNIPITEYVDGQFVEYSADDILKDTQNWFISQLNTGNSIYLFENSLINDIDLNVLLKLSNSKTGKALPPSIEINEDNGSKVSEKKEKVEKADLNKDESTVIANALNLLNNVITEATWVCYTENTYDYNVLFKLETMKKMFREEDLNTIVDDILNKSEKMREIMNQLFINKKITFDSLSSLEISKHIFINSKFKQNMGIVYMMDEIAKKLVDDTVIGEYDNVLVYNALNGSLPLAIKNKYPNVTIYCKETFSQYENYLSSLGCNIIKDDMKTMVNKMKYDGILLNAPYQEIISNEGEKLKTNVIWSEINVNAFNVLKSGGYLATIHPSGWRFATNGSSNDLKDIGEIYRNNKIISMEFHDVKEGMKVFNSNTDYDIIVLKKEPSDGIVNIKTKTDGLVSININDYNVIPTDNFKLYDTLIGDDKVEVIRNSAYHTMRDYISNEKTDEFNYPCVYGYPKGAGLKLKYSSRNDRGHFGIPKLILIRASQTTILDLTGEYGMNEFSLAIVDTPENLIKIQKAVESIEFLELKNYFCGIADVCKNSIIDPTGMLFKFIKEFKKDFWKEFDID